MLGFDDDAPGPGSYNLSGLKKNNKESKFQFFGSTANRFSTEYEMNDVGPGHYNTEKQS